MNAPVSKEAESFAAEFCAKWSDELSFQFPLAMVEDLAVRAEKATHVPILGFVNGKIVEFDGSTGTPPSGTAGRKSTEGDSI